MQIMRRIRFRKAVRGRMYTLEELLRAQPGKLRKDPDYRAMIDHFTSSGRLQQLRISRKCYSLLNRATVRPENVDSFLRTYRLPKDPFFPLFFTVKHRYLMEREYRKEKRHQYILTVMRSLPAPVIQAVKYLGYLERHYNTAGNSPVWQKNLFPGSQKTADAYTLYTPAGWAARFQAHLLLLKERYGMIPDAVIDRTHACLVLELIPDRIPPVKPPAAEINRNYRRLSMLHHPDRGGDPVMFIIVRNAREALLG